MLFRNKSSNISNFSVLQSKTGSEAVSGFGIGRVSFVGYVYRYGANSNRDVVGRSFGCWFCEDCCLDVLGTRCVESLKTPVIMLRLFIWVVLETAAFDYMGVEDLVG